MILYGIMMKVQNSFKKEASSENGLVLHIMWVKCCATIFFNKNARVKVRSTVQALTKDEFNLVDIKEQIKNLDALINQRIGEEELADIPFDLQDDLEGNYEILSVRMGMIR
jgi:hypothetical protein